MKRVPVFWQFWNCAKSEWRWLLRLELLGNILREFRVKRVMAASGGCSSGSAIVVVGVECFHNDLFKGVNRCPVKVVGHDLPWLMFDTFEWHISGKSGVLQSAKISGGRCAKASLPHLLLC